MAEPYVLPLELTAPLIQRLARKGRHTALTRAECAQLCECVLFHIDRMLDERRVPKLGDGYFADVPTPSPTP
jgi:hypothetical protein